MTGWLGCKQEQVQKDQPVPAFTADVEGRLNAFDERLSQVKSDLSERPEGARNTIEVATERAEEKIETLRKHTLPLLAEAKSEEEIERIKETVNTTLDEIEKAVVRAEQADANAMSEREVFTKEASAALDELRERYEEVKEQAEDLEAAVEAEIELALESAEEAIQEAEKSLDAYKKSAEDQAGEIRGNIDGLLTDARRYLDRALSSLESAE